MFAIYIDIVVCYPFNFWCLEFNAGFAVTRWLQHGSSLN